MGKLFRRIHLIIYPMNWIIVDIFHMILIILPVPNNMIIKRFLPNGHSRLFGYGSLKLFNHPIQCRGDLWSPVFTWGNDNHHMQMIWHNYIPRQRYGIIRFIPSFQFVQNDLSGSRQRQIMRANTVRPYMTPCKHLRVKITVPKYILLFIRAYRNKICRRGTVIIIFQANPFSLIHFIRYHHPPLPHHYNTISAEKQHLCRYSIDHIFSLFSFTARMICGRYKTTRYTARITTAKYIYQYAQGMIFQKMSNTGLPGDSMENI